jgi:RHS repeat-associated protein
MKVTGFTEQIIQDFVSMQAGSRIRAAAPPRRHDVGLLKTFCRRPPRVRTAHRAGHPRCPSHRRRATEIASPVNRYYDPGTGQFLSVDPLVNLTEQPYQYAGDDPVNNTDPTGLFCILGHNPDGSCRGASYWRDVVDVPQDFAYLNYWGAYEAIGGLKKIGSIVGEPGCVIAEVLGAQLVPWEAAGLGGQALGSLVKGQSIWLQGIPNQPLLGNQQVPLLGNGRQWTRDLGLPFITFPGFNYYTHQIDFRW